MRADRHRIQFIIEQAEKEGFHPVDYWDFPRTPTQDPGKVDIPFEDVYNLMQLLSRLRRQLETAKEDERKRIAQMLIEAHDSTKGGSYFHAGIYHAATLVDPSIRDGFAEMEME